MILIPCTTYYQASSIKRALEQLNRDEETPVVRSKLVLPEVVL